MKYVVCILIIFTLGADYNILAQDNFILNNNLNSNSNINRNNDSTHYIKTSTFFISKKLNPSTSTVSHTASNKQGYTYPNDRDHIIDSVYHFSYGKDTVVSKEILTNCYDAPIMISSYIKEDNTWAPLGKIEFMYKEEGYDIIEAHYTYKDGFKLAKKIYINTDAQENIVLRAEKKWENIVVNWNEQLVTSNYDNHLYKMISNNTPKKQLQQ